MAESTKLKGRNLLALGENVLTFDDIYPVGSIYMSVNPDNPGTLFGGTWLPWSMGRMPIGIGAQEGNTYSGHGDTPEGANNFSIPEMRGGAHLAGMPSHQHSTPAHTHTGTATAAGAHTHTTTLYDNTNDYSGPSSRNALHNSVGTVRKKTSSSAGSHAHTVTVASSGAGISGVKAGVHGYNYSPYITCYMWKRVTDSM